MTKDRIKIEDSTPNENGNNKINQNFKGFKFIKKDSTNGILYEIWQDVKDNSTNNTNWQLLSRWNEKPDNRPIWITWDEWIANPDKWRGKNYRIKSEPTCSDPYINNKGEICYTMTDEYDHMYTMRLDNPMGLDAKQAKDMMNDLTKDCKNEKNED